MNSSVIVAFEKLASTALTACELTIKFNRSFDQIKARLRQLEKQQTKQRAKLAWNRKRRKRR